MLARVATALALICLSCLTGVSSALAAVNVFACEPEWAVLAQEIGGPDVTVFAATTARQDPHHIEARPALVARLRAAQFLICTGAELEIGWLPVLQRQAANASIQPGQPGELMVAENFRLLEKPEKLDRAMGDIHAAGNPHVQLDPRVLRAAAGLVAERLAQVDPAHAAAYRSRQAQFQQRMDQSIARWEQLSTPLIGSRIIAHHKGFTYLFAWLGMKEVANLEPVPGVPPGAAFLSQIVTTAPQLGAQAIVYAAYQSPKAATFVGEKTGLPAVELPYTVGGSDRARDLFSLFDDTIGRLMAAIKPRR
jgi:zinc/manganese transport system substrate-binding protein